MEEHFGILHKSHELVKQYGIILSEKKIILVKDEMDFLGMHFAHGAYDTILTRRITTNSGKQER
ncbi:hypothetical protein KY289_030370 [Solanum tuberosum]|nr:hypothetical protein KY289_030370 [Solanum tuberosum]